MFSITQPKGMKMVPFCLLEVLIILSTTCLHLRYFSWNLQFLCAVLFKKWRLLENVNNTHCYSIEKSFVFVLCFCVFLGEQHIILILESFLTFAVCSNFMVIESIRWQSLVDLQRYLISLIHCTCNLFKGTFGYISIILHCFLVCLYFLVHEIFYYLSPKKKKV